MQYLGLLGARSSSAFAAGFGGMWKLRGHSVTRATVSSNVSASGRVAQLVRAPALQAGGRWFESVRAHSEICLVARVRRVVRDRSKIIPLIEL